MRDLLFYHEIEDLYEEMLNECYEPVTICDAEYEQGSVLKELDPIAFRCEVSDWCDAEFEEVNYSDMTDEERDEYCVSEHQTMYVRVEE